MGRPRIAFEPPTTPTARLTLYHRPCPPASKIWNLYSPVARVPLAAIAASMALANSAGRLNPSDMGFSYVVPGAMLLVLLPLPPFPALALPLLPLPISVGASVCVCLWGLGSEGKGERERAGAWGGGFLRGGGFLLGSEGEEKGKGVRDKGWGTGAGLHTSLCRDVRRALGLSPFVCLPASDLPPPLPCMDGLLPPAFGANISMK